MIRRFRVSDPKIATLGDGQVSTSPVPSSGRTGRDRIGRSAANANATTRVEKPNGAAASASRGARRALAVSRAQL
jgi:hypothetical protein